MIFEPMTLNRAIELYNKISQEIINNQLKLTLQEDIIFFTENFTRDYGTPKKQVKFYVEITHCEDCSNYAIQSKWFDTIEQAREWFEKDIDFLGEDYNAYIMQAEYDETSDSYGDIAEFEQIFKRS